MMLVALLLAQLLEAPAAVSPDVLEPSVRNEVEHALDTAPTNAAFSAGAEIPADVFGTNGLDRTSIAIRLVSSQRADGRWMCGTNDVTAVAVDILMGL